MQKQRFWQFLAACSTRTLRLSLKQTANKTEAVEKWLDVIYSGLKAVRKECGLETAAALVNLGLERCCLYPGEMMQAALCLEKGENGRQIFEKIESGEIDCTDLFSPVSRRDAEGRRTVRERLADLKKRNGRGKDKGR